MNTLTTEERIDQIFEKFNPTGNKLGHFKRHKSALLALINEERLKLLKTIRRSYPKKQTAQGNATSKLTLADIDRMIGELQTLSQGGKK